MNLLFPPRTRRRAAIADRAASATFLVAALGALLGAAGCATTGATAPPAAVDGADVAPYRRPAPDNADVAPAPVAFVGDGAFAFVDGRTGAALAIEDVVARVRAHRVVMVGEQHDQATHHEAQRRVVEMAGATGPGLVVGLEMLTWEKQAALDRFNRGEVDVDALDGVVDWKKAWGFDFGLYAPVFRAGRGVGASFVALNAPRPLVRAVREKGVDGLAEDERSRVPELDLGDTLHRRWFEGVFASAGHPLKPAELDGFYRAQVLWDEAMADTATRALRGGARQVIVLAGAGHVALGRGVPQRIERRLAGERVLTLVPVKADADNVADVVRKAIAAGEGDILIVPRFEVELSL
jgi:uncharacterized iron-regulated protein